MCTPLLLCCAKSLQSCPTLRSYGTQLTRLPCPWDSPGKNTQVGCHALLQGIFLSQGLNSRLRHCRQILYTTLTSNMSHSCIPLSLTVPPAWNKLLQVANATWKTHHLCKRSISIHRFGFFSSMLTPTIVLTTKAEFITYSSYTLCKQFVSKHTVYSFPYS